MDHAVAYPSMVMLLARRAAPRQQDQGAGAHAHHEVAAGRAHAPPDGAAQIGLVLLAVAVDAQLDARLLGDPHHGLLGRVQLVTAGAADPGGVHVVGPEGLAQVIRLMAAHADAILLAQREGVIAKAHHIDHATALFTVIY